MRKAKKRSKISDSGSRFSAKRGRGRPVKVVASAVRSHADRYRTWFTRIWDELGGLLLAAQTEQDVVNAIRKVIPGNNDLVPLAPLILTVTKDKRFPGRQKARIRFLADSVAGQGLVTPRRSRDICKEQRKADALRHQILRYEYWIVCSCGYQGLSVGHRCMDCGAVLYVPGVSSEFD